MGILLGRDREEVDGVKLIRVELVARDDNDVAEINRHLESSGALNEYPCFAWETVDASPAVVEWMRTEYDPDSYDGKGDE